MNPTAATGISGEQAATEHLRRAGYDICALNWREGRYELDIVARRWEVLHFVEVKTRRAGSLTPPEAAMTALKCAALQQAARRYIAATRWRGEIQFDLAAVDRMPDGRYEVRMIENAVESHW